jgi:hypothetical protein
VVAILCGQLIHGEAGAVHGGDHVHGEDHVHDEDDVHGEAGCGFVCVRP